MYSSYFFRFPFSRIASTTRGSTKVSRNINLNQKFQSKLGILDNMISQISLGDINARFYTQGSIEGYVHNLMYKKEAPDFYNKKRGFYLYHTENLEEIHALVVHDSHTHERLNITHLAKEDKQCQDILKDIKWPENANAEVKLDDKLVKFITSNFEHDRIENTSTKELRYSSISGNTVKIGDSENEVAPETKETTKENTHKNQQDKKTDENSSKRNYGIIIQNLILFGGAVGGLAAFHLNFQSEKQEHFLSLKQEILSNLSAVFFDSAEYRHKSELNIDCLRQIRKSFYYNAFMKVLSAVPLLPDQKLLLNMMLLLYFSRDTRVKSAKYIEKADAIILMADERFVSLELITQLSFFSELAIKNVLHSDFAVDEEMKESILLELTFMGIVQVYIESLKYISYAPSMCTLFFKDFNDDFEKVRNYQKREIKIIIDIYNKVKEKEYTLDEILKHIHEVFHKPSEENHRVILAKIFEVEIPEESTDSNTHTPSLCTLISKLYPRFNQPESESRLGLKFK